MEHTHSEEGPGPQPNPPNTAAKAFLASMDIGATEGEQPKAMTEQELIEESRRYAQTAAAMEALLKAQGAVDPDTADQFLESINLCRIRVLGDQTCAMTVVALQTMLTGGPLDKAASLNIINATIAGLSPEDKTTIFNTSRLYNSDMMELGGEEEYFRDLLTTSDTYLDAGQILALGHARKVPTWHFFHMDVPAQPNTIKHTSVTLSCAKNDQTMDQRMVGKAIFINEGGVGHWDVVTNLDQKAAWKGSIPGAWFLRNGVPTHTSERLTKKTTQKKAEQNKANEPPATKAPPSKEPNKKRLASFRKKLDGAKRANTTSKPLVEAQKAPLVSSSVLPPGDSSIASPQERESKTATTKATKKRKKRKKETAAAATEEQISIESEPSKEAEEPRNREWRLGYHTWTTRKESQTASTTIITTPENETVLTSTLEAQSEHTKMNATPQAQTLTVETIETKKTATTAQNAATRVQTSSESQTTSVLTTTTEGTLDTGAKISKNMHQSTSDTSSVKILTKTTLVDRGPQTLMTGGQKILNACMDFISNISHVKMVLTAHYETIKNTAVFFSQLSSLMQEEASEEHHDWDKGDCQYWMNRRLAPEIEIDDYEGEDRLEFCIPILDVIEKKPKQPPKAKSAKVKLRQEKNHGYEQEGQWRDLLDAARQAACKDLAEEFSDDEVLPDAQGEPRIRIYDPGESRKTAEIIIEKLDEATRNHVQGSDLPFTERTASELTMYIQTHAPRLEEKYNRTLITVIERFMTTCKDKKYRSNFLMTLTELCTTSTTEIRPHYVRSTAAAVVRILGDTEDTNVQALKSCRNALAHVQRVGKYLAIKTIIELIEVGLKSDSPFKFDEKARFIILGFITPTDWTDLMAQGEAQSVEDSLGAMSLNTQPLDGVEQERVAARNQWTRVKIALRPTSNSPSGVIDWRTASSKKKEKDIKTVMFWNVDGLSKRIDEVLHILIRDKPSVVVLTEIKGDGTTLLRIGPEKDLRKTLRDLGYDCVSASTCALESIGPGNYGVMILSRRTPASVLLGFGETTNRDHEDLSRKGRVVTMRFENPKITIVGAYAPCSKIGTVHQRRLTFDKLMTEHLIREARDTHLLYVADTNVAPEGRDADTSMMDPEDVKKMPSCMPEERQAYRDLLRNANMVDVYREMNENAGPESFTWHTRSPTNHQFPVGMRIDMAMCKRDDYESKFVENCEVLRYGSSDHSALKVTLKKQNRRALASEEANVEAKQIFPDTDPLTDYGEVVAPLIFEKLLAVRWGFEPSQSFVKRLKEEIGKCPIGSERAEILQSIQQNLSEEEEPETDAFYEDRRKGTYEECRQKGYGHEIGVGNTNDPDDYDQDVERPYKLPWDKLRNDCPMLRTKFYCTVPKWTVTTHCLGDTGAKSNIITLELLKKDLKYRHIRVHDGAKPTFIMADGRRTKPIRRVELDFCIKDDHNNDAWFTEQFWVMQTGCVDVILGAEFLKNKNAKINFKDGTVKVTGRATKGKTNLTSEATQGTHIAVMLATDEEAVPMICARTTQLLSGYHYRVPCFPKSSNLVEVGQWGTLQPIMEDTQFLTGTGPTTIGPWTSTTTSNWCQISNPTERTITIPQGTVVAAFHRGCEDSYDILDWDVDVEERLLEHLEKKALAQDTEKAVKAYKNQLDAVQSHNETVALSMQAGQDKETTPKEAEEQPGEKEPVKTTTEANGKETVPQIAIEALPPCEPPPEASQEELDKAFSDKESPISSISFGDKINANPDYLRKMRQLVYKYRHLWRTPSFTTGETKVPNELWCRIVTDNPFTGKPRMHSTNASMREVIRKEVTLQRKAGIIEPSASPFASSILLVPKKDGTTRFCIDYRALNACTRKDGYVMPRVDDSLSALLGSQYFTSLDLTAAFNQIPIPPEHRDMTLFSTPDGTWRYTRMPFGLINGPAIFTRFIDTVLAGLKWSVCMVYMDDILVYFPTFEKHIMGLEQVFSRMNDFGLTFKAKKCFIGNEEVKYLGHIVSTCGVKPDPDKIKAIKDMKIPENKDQMRSALGLFGYYRRFCKNFSQVANPLTKSLRKGVRLKYKTNEEGKKVVDWNAEQLGAFEKLQTMLIEGAVLAHPDWTSPFTIHTDACDHGIGAALIQTIDGVERVISFVSRTLTVGEMNYNTYEKECLAIIWSCELWYTLYLYGRKFTVITDNQALTWLFGKTHKSPISSRLSKWIIRMQDLDFTTLHRKGSQHCNADGLSRNPLKSTAPYGEKSTEPLYGMPPPIMCTAQCENVTHEESMDRRGWKQINKEAFDANKQYHASCLDFRIHGQNASCTYFGTQDKEAENSEEWIELQREDETCKNLIKALEKPSDPPTERETKLQTLYTMKDRLLYKLPGANVTKSKKAKHKEKSVEEDEDKSCKLCSRPQRQLRFFDHTKPRMVVPTSLKAFILYKHHGLPIAGHDGRKRVYASLRERFYWDGMYKDTKRWIHACTTCARRKTPRPMKAGEPQALLPRAPGDWSVDVQGPLPITKDGNRYLLTMLDCFLHWGIAVPIPDTKASTVSKAIFKHILCNHGRPRVILTDRGNELIGKAVAHLCKRWGIKKIATTGEQPQSNPVERFHRYLNSSMTALHGSFGLDWDHYVDAAVFTYRVSYCEASGHSPFYMLYGREAVKPQDILFGGGPEKEFESEEAYATHTCTALAVAYKEAYEEQAARAHHNVEYRRKFMRQTTFIPGQKVHYWQAGASDKQQLEEYVANDDEEEATLTEERSGSTFLLPRKWKYRWTGPHTIIGKSTTSIDTDESDNIIPNNYEVRHCTTGKTFRANVNRLTKFNKWSESILSTSPTSITRVGFQTTGIAEIGSLLIIPFAEVQADNAPIMIGKLLSRDDDTQHLEFQWLWNRNGNMLQPMHLGWNKPNGGYTWTQPKSKDAAGYTAFTNINDEGAKECTDNQVICHGFTLNKQGYLPETVLRFLTEHEQVPWGLDDNTIPWRGR
jgi:exodeoxyribonuclease III